VTDILERVREAAGLEGRDAARAALRSVICSLRERLSAEEVDALRAALSAVPEVFTCDHPGHTHRPATRRSDRLTEPEMVARVLEELHLPGLAEARRVTRGVLEALAADVTATPAEEAVNEAVSVGSLGRPRRGSAEDEDEG
jgi:uncharacterized protein (DUF2267 family)